MIIGICGGSGSGKTTLLNKLKDEFASLKPAVISLDNYYLPIEKQAIDPNGKVNFDLPTALDRQKIGADIAKITNGETLRLREYHFNSPSDLVSYITVHPSEIIILEGLFILHYEEVRDLLDVTIFVQLDPNIQLERRILRDKESRGYSLDDILYQWENHVLPCYENYIQPYQQHANYFFRNDLHIMEDFERIKMGIYSKLKDKSVNPISY
jgi:uridine kinase